MINITKLIIFSWLPILYMVIGFYILIDWNIETAIWKILYGIICTPLALILIYTQAWRNNGIF
jgi:hypothetical protein